MKLSTRLIRVLGLLSALHDLANAIAPSDSYSDADIGQSGYAGGAHGLDTETVSKFKQLWNATFTQDEKHYARPLVYTLQSGKQIVFTASTENIIRTFDATTGESIDERQVAPPWPMDAADCGNVSKNMGIMGTPVIDPGHDIAFFYVKSYIENYRVPGGATSPMNSVYYLYAVHLETLLDVYKFPLILDSLPADNDPRKIFIGGLVLQQQSLLLQGDMLYAGFGGMCDAFNYTGVLVAVNVAARRINTWVTQAGLTSRFSSNWTLRHGGGPGGIWQAGMGPASDGKDVYFTIDNGEGSNDTNVSTKPVAGKTPQDVLSESVVRVSATDAGVRLVDFFRPYDYQQDGNRDIGSGGFAVLDPFFNTSAGGRIGIATGKNSKFYVQDLNNLGGYRQGSNGTDGVLETIYLKGEIYGGVGSYPLEGGFIYVNPSNSPLTVYRWIHLYADHGEYFGLAGRSSTSKPLGVGVGTPTVTSNNGTAGSGIVWVTDTQEGLLAFKAKPVNARLVPLDLPKIEGAMKYGRPVFGDRKVYIIDGKDRLIALGVS